MTTTPFDCDNALRAVMMRAVDCPSRLTIPSHSHRRAEFVYVRSGMLCLTADNALFTVIAQNALLIPAGTVHDMRMLSDTVLVTAYIALPDSACGGKGCQSIPMSGLLRELMRIAVDLPPEYDSCGRDGRVMDLITEEVAWLISQPSTPMLHTPAPTDTRLTRLCRDLLGQLDRVWTIDDAAAAAGMGRRTFTRAFRREIGISFNAWCLRARMNAAIGRLNAGASVTEVAFESGYESPSAFATMFKKCLGMPPSNYQAALRN